MKNISSTGMRHQSQRFSSGFATLKRSVVFQFLIILAIGYLGGVVTDHMNQNVTVSLNQARAMPQAQAVQNAPKNTVITLAHLRFAVYKHQDNLLKITGGQALSMMGRPDFIFREMPSVIWQYRTDFCVLDLFFVSEGPFSDMEMGHYALRGRDTKNLSENQTQKCVKTILARGVGRVSDAR